MLSPSPVEHILVYAYSSLSLLQAITDDSLQLDRISCKLANAVSKLVRRHFILVVLPAETILVHRYLLNVHLLR